MKQEEYRQLCQEAQNDYEAFWAKRAQSLTWQKPFSQTLQWEPPFAKWFLGGTLNACENCVDKHLLTERKNKRAIIWESERGETKTLTYTDLYHQVCHLSTLLLNAGIQAGDRVAIYMPLIPEAIVAMLACARIGTTHNVVFGGFSAESLRNRILDSECKAVITADGGFRKGAVLELKNAVDKALENGVCPSVNKVFVFRHANTSISMKNRRDIEWKHQSSLIEKSRGFPSEHPLFVLYTSGTTGKPKGIVHGTAGYLTQVASTFDWVFDPREDDIYWCTADVGWVTGHSYGVYGPLFAGATLVMYEGAPLFPEPDRFWRIIERYGVTTFYTAPTAIRMFMQHGDEWVRKHDLSSLRLLGTVGEPINPEAWRWYSQVVGGGRCPIVDTWWQTETGAIMISPIPGVTSLQPGSATLALPGLDVDVVDGFLVIKKPWPSMMLGLWGDNGERLKKTYWSQIPGVYFAGDGAIRDENGYFWISGRTDDVLKIAGHRLGTYEIESSIAEHAAVAECAVVGKPDEIKGQAVVGFVVLKDIEVPGIDLEKEIAQHVAQKLGAFAKPAEIRFVSQLPKTRSGKIMRRLLRELVTHGKISGDVSTLEDAVLSNLTANG